MSIHWESTPSQEYRQQQYFYDDADGQKRIGYDSEAELEASFVFFHHEYIPKDFGEYAAQWEPPTWQKFLMRLTVCASAVLFVLAVWLASAAYFGFQITL